MQQALEAGVNRQIVNADSNAASKGKGAAGSMALAGRGATVRRNPIRVVQVSEPPSPILTRRSFTMHLVKLFSAAAE